LNVVDGCIPSDMATRTDDEIEEERRLLYVAMTRAKDELDLVVPQRFYTYQQSKTGDRHVYACRSRFIPEGIIESVDHGCCSKPTANVAIGSPHITDKENVLSLSVMF
jgi:DNA helicase-2/ATP-dependent DNA helicase PcrA